MPDRIPQTTGKLEDFIRKERLPATFRNLAEEHYLNLASWLISMRDPAVPYFLGINGAQGTGKSTLAEFLKLALEDGVGWHVAVLSLDDFYYTRLERFNLAERIHPLLATRGVPGTHDLRMLQRQIDQLRALKAGSSQTLPRFDKSRDDRMTAKSWPKVRGPIDLIILEGWCVCSQPQPAADLLPPINELELKEDGSGLWRRYVNDQLATGYADIFAQIDALVFLSAPSFDAVYHWRLEQERKLSNRTRNDNAGIMNESELTRFIQHYERLTRANLVVLPEIADVVFAFNTEHECVRSHYAAGPK